MKTVALATLGCKVNQCESAYLEEKLCKGNFHIRPFTEEADLYCINTCAVTSRAAMQSRQLIRRAARLNSEAKIVVMGCYSQIAAEEISAIPGVTHILGTSEKLALLDYISLGGEYTSTSIHLENARNAPDPTPLVFSAFSHRTRAFLKTQDGCDAFCSYCIVPYARGRSRSIPLVSLLALFANCGKDEISVGIWQEEQFLPSLTKPGTENPARAQSEGRLLDLIAAQ